MIRNLARSLVLLPLLIAAPAALAADLTLKPMQFRAADGTVVAAERGEITVREDRADPKSRNIKLAFVRFKSTAAKPGAPIVYLAGGPGGSGIAAASGPRFGAFMKLREVADVIAFDQRGTGSSTPVPACQAQPLDLSKPLTREVVLAHYVASLKVCWDKWKAQGIAIDAYDTLASAADLDELRQDLKAPKLNLWGISYGTHLGLAYMKTYPRRVDRVILAGVEGLDQTVKLPLHADETIKRIAAVVAADPEAQTPDLVGLMRRVHAKLDANPATWPMGPPGQTFIADSYALRAMAGQMIKNPDQIGTLVQFYKAADAGAYAAIGPIIASQLFPVLRSVAGMPDAMDVASGITPARLALVREQAKTALLSDSLNFPMPYAANAIPGVDLGDRYRAPFRSRRPILVIAGDLDGRTPLEEQAEGVAGLKYTQITVTNAGHDIFEAEPRLWPLMASFLAGQKVPTQTITKLAIDVVPARRP
jgi:pimeloyl-ACP methyl ester carboxylesterase